jgi:hypothetical protein
LAGHLTAENHRSVLETATHKTKREVEQQVAALRPLPAVASSVRRLPTPKASATLQLEAARTPPNASEPFPRVLTEIVQRASVSVDRPAIVAPLAPESYKVQFTIARETYERLRRVQDLLRHSVTDGDLAVIFDRALALLLTDLQKKRLALTDRPRSTSTPLTRSRHVPAAVRREVWLRDRGQCAFEGATGRCAERGFLEFHHVLPFAAGGPTTVANLQLRCRAHNGYEAELHF